MTNQKRLKITKHSDSGHGWFAVKRKHVESIMGLDGISQYSYQKGKTVYLEQDRDAAKLISKMKEQGIEYEGRYAKHHESSPIRHYDRFSMV